MSGDHNEPTVSEQEPPAPESSGRRRARRVFGVVRWFAVGVLTLLLVASTIASVAAVFVRDELLDTDNFVERAELLAEDRDVQDEVADRITAELDKVLDTETLSREAKKWISKEDPPERVEAVMRSAVSGLREQLSAEVREFVTTQRFADAWSTAVSKAHSELMEVLDRRQGEVLHSAGTTLSVELGPVIELIRSELIDSGIDIAEQIPPMQLDIQLADSDLVPRLQEYTQLLRTAALWLPWVNLGCLVALLLVAPRRPRAIMITGTVVAIVVGGLAVALWVLRGRYIAQLDDALLSSAARVFTAGFVPPYAVIAATAILTVIVVGLLRRWWKGRGTTSETTEPSAPPAELNPS